MKHVGPSPKGTFNRAAEDAETNGFFYTAFFIFVTMPVSLAVCWVTDCWEWMRGQRAKYFSKKGNR